MSTLYSLHSLHPTKPLLALPLLQPPFMHLTIQIRRHLLKRPTPSPCHLPQMIHPDPGFETRAARVPALVQALRRGAVMHRLGQFIERCVRAFGTEEDFILAFAVGVSMTTSPAVAPTTLASAVPQLFPINDREYLERGNQYEPYGITRQAILTSS